MDKPPRIRRDNPMVGAQGIRMRLTKRDIAQIDARLRTVLSREVDCLLVATYKRKKLAPRDAATLVSYIRLVNELKQLEALEAQTKAIVKKSET